jgi:hypothetical protein
LGLTSLAPEPLDVGSPDGVPGTGLPAGVSFSAFSPSVRLVDFQASVAIIAVVSARTRSGRASAFKIRTLAVTWFRLYGVLRLLEGAVIHALYLPLFNPWDGERAPVTLSQLSLEESYQYEATLRLRVIHCDS